jgi:hypothetical protein
MLPDDNFGRIGRIDLSREDIDFESADFDVLDDGMFILRALTSGSGLLFRLVPPFLAARAGLSLQQLEQHSTWEYSFITHKF